MRRDWAASKGGATVDRQRRHRRARSAAALDQVIDQSQGAGWSPFNPDSADPENPHAGPPTATIALPRPVDIASFGMDPSNTCGDDPSATTKDYRIETSTDGDQVPGRQGGRASPPTTARG